jgi:tRNA(Leu) C34 or U34 (ribose-2'-O)-methylase TrmL
MTARGITPAVLLADPKYPDNVGRTLRTCALLGVSQLWYTGTRCRDRWEAMSRLPREERMPRYTARTELIAAEGRWLEHFPSGTVPVAVEVCPGAEDLAWFEHPERAVYVFGPEDGSLSAGVKSACHRFLVLPSDGGPLNLSVAVGWVLGDRRVKAIRAGLIDPVPAFDRVKSGPQ